eukprot:8619810-Pyramimonas_sp.AAC.1
MASIPAWQPSVKRKASQDTGGDDRRQRLEQQVVGQARQELKGKEGGIVAALLTVLRRLPLANARDLAEITGAAFTCFLLPATAALIK